MCFDNLLLDGGNLFWGMRFRTCENFGESTDSSLVLSPKFSQIQKPHRHYFDCDSQGESTTNQIRIYNSRHCEANRRFAKAIQLKNQSARSVNLCKSFCYFWLLPKVESHLPLNPNLPIAQSKQIVGDSRIAKMDSSLTAFAQNDESVDCHDFATQNLAMTGVFRFGTRFAQERIERQIKCLKTQKRQLLRF